MGIEHDPRRGDNNHAPSCKGAGLEKLIELTREATAEPGGQLFTGRLLEASRRARQYLPHAQRNLESAMRSYRHALAEKAHPLSLSSITMKIGRFMGIIRPSTLEDLYNLQSRCFAYMLDIIEDLASEASYQESLIAMQRDEIAGWIDCAGPAIEQAKQAIRAGYPPSRGYSATKRTQHSHLMRDRRREASYIEQMEILYHSRRELLPALERYALAAEDIAQSVLSLKAHAVAAAEYFERTFGPAQFLESATEAMPFLERSIEGMDSHHCALEESISNCIRALGRVRGMIGSYGGGR